MDSYTSPQDERRPGKILYTVASTFEKRNCFNLKLLFGKPCMVKTSSMHPVDFYEHYFQPGDIFGMEMISNGKEYRHCHQIFILKACSEGEVGQIVPGVKPGAEVLLHTSKKLFSLKFLLCFNRIAKLNHGIGVLSDKKIKYLNTLINTKINHSYFLESLLYEASNQR